MEHPQMHYSVDEAKNVQRRFRAILVISILTLAVGTVVMMHLEQLSFIDAMYFSVVSLTTVGFGDITPKTDPGKVFTVVYLIVGIGIVAGLINTLLQSAVARRVIVRSEKSVEDVKSIVEKHSKEH